MKILLTGAGGNFGREFLKQADFEVIQLNRSDWDDIDIKLAQNIDVVIHAASDLHTQASISPVSLFNSNLLSTAALLEAMHKHQVPRFIFLSSCAVYGEDMRTNEDNQCCPVSINGISKLLNEKLIAEFCSVHGIKFEILRVFNMYGGQDKFSIISRLERALETGAPFTLNNMGIAQRDFIHVSDVASVVLKLLKRNIPYTHLNIGTGVATKISTLVELVIKRFPDLSIRHAQAKEAEYSRADITRLREFVDIDFIKIEKHLENDFMKKQLTS
ncbi:MAG: SDR family oxidoreductase [Gallionella sp.]|nr:SDR family oxidoreductase [Gallionella sp.]